MLSRATAVASRLGCELWCVSSKTGEGISRLFARVAAVTFDSVMKVTTAGEEAKVIGEGLVGENFQ